MKIGKKGTAVLNKDMAELRKQKVSDAGASAAAATISSIVPLVTLPVGLGAVHAMAAIPKKMSGGEIDAINVAANEILEKVGLAAKGVKINNIRFAGINLFMPDKLMELINPYYATANGKNAFFTSKAIKDATGKIIQEANSIGINRAKLPTAVFHEMGHAFNYNCSAFWKTMQKMRIPAMIIAASFALFSAFTKKAEAKDGQELTKGQKAKNFVRKNSGILAFAAMLPVIAEETMASVRGCSWAKANMTKDLFKKVLKTNAFSAASYIATAVGLGLSAYAATKIKDKIVEKNNAKKQELQKNIQQNSMNKPKEVA